MRDNRALIVHFHDGTTLSFIFPRRVDDHSVKENMRQVLGGEQLVVEADGSLFVIPRTSIKYMQTYPAPDTLPENAVVAATLAGDA